MHLNFKLGPRQVELLIAVIVTGIMSGVVSAISTARTIGLSEVIEQPLVWLSDWSRAYVVAWPVAFLIFKLVSPRVRRGIERLFGKTPSN